MEQALRLAIDDDELQCHDQRGEHGHVRSSVEEAGDEEEAQRPEEASEEHHQPGNGPDGLDAVADDLECPFELEDDAVEGRPRREHDPEGLGGDEEPRGEDEGDDVDGDDDDGVGPVCDGRPGDTRSE